MQKEMIRAAKKGDAAAVRALLKSDPSLIGATDTDGSTPLHCAAWKGHEEVAIILLDAGANPNAHNQNTHYGTTPLHAAAHGNQTALVRLLLARGADRNATDTFGKTPLDHTGFHGAKAAKLLAG